MRAGLASQEVGESLKAAAFLLFGIECWQHRWGRSICVADIGEQGKEGLYDLLHLGSGQG